MCCAALVLVATPSAAPAVAKPAADSGPQTFTLDRPPQAYVPGRILVGYDSGVTKREAGVVHARGLARSVQRISGVGIDVVALRNGVTVPAAVARYEADPRVAFAEPDYLRYRSETVPTDALFGHNWGLRNVGQTHALSDSGSLLAGTADADIDASNAWDTQLGTDTTVIAVIDDGLATSHPDLATQLWQNPREAGGTSGVDDDGNGKTDDVNGWDFAHGDAGLLAPETVPGGNDHGTHVGGTIAAALNNAGPSSGVVGVCPGCKLMGLKIMSDSGQISLSDEIKAIAYAKAEGADIINLSLGGASFSRAERAALLAAKSKLLAVVAAGNESLDNDMFLSRDSNGDGDADSFSPSYPASYTAPNVLAVAASNHHDEYGYFTACATGAPKRLCAFTNWGHDSVDVAAPGVDVLSTTSTGWAAFAGTSMATPHVAGVAGIVKSQRSDLTPTQLKNAILNSVDEPPSLRKLNTPIFATEQTGDFTRTSGRVNVHEALTGSTANATPASDGNIDGAKTMKTRAKKGSVAWPADTNDVWKRKLTRGKRYRLVLDGPAGRDFNLLVWKPGTREIWQIEQACGSGGSACAVAAAALRPRRADEKVTFRATKTGMHYFQVTAWLGNAGRYKLKLVSL